MILYDSLVFFGKMAWRRVQRYKLYMKPTTKRKKEEFEDTKGISKKNRQHNGQKKKDKRTNNDLQNIHIKLKIE
jgi:ribosomal protein S21